MNACSWKRRLVLYAVIAVGLVAGFGSMASSAGKVVTFGFTCASPRTALPPAVKQVVSGLGAKGGDRVVTYGDRAVSLRLRRGSEMTYFVPLSCDGWGNCDWAIVVPSPARSLGVISGTLFNLKTGGSQWPEVYAFSTPRPGADGIPKGAMETLEFKDDGYHRKELTDVDPRLVNTLAACLEDKSCCPPES